jgi:hypothetical protein
MLLHNLSSSHLSLIYLQALLEAVLAKAFTRFTSLMKRLKAQ